MLTTAVDELSWTALVKYLAELLLYLTSGYFSLSFCNQIFLTRPPKN